jgi:hypothetical protein
MKILKEGNKNTWGLELHCTGKGNNEEHSACGAKLLVESEDIFTTHHYDYGGGSESYFTFKCPQCKTLTDIPDKKIPPRIQSNIWAKREIGSNTDNGDK